MVPVSIVIITKNEGAIIGRCLEMCSRISDDIIIVDNGSTDDTLAIANGYGCGVYQKDWDGYGANKNKGIALAGYDWILSIDADEIPDRHLVDAILSIHFLDPNIAYDIRFKTYFGDKQIKHGAWGHDHHLRLFNRTKVKWSETEVHETLLLPKGMVIKKLSGHLHHYSVNNLTDYRQKALHYAELSAIKYLNEGKNASAYKLYLSPLFGFVINYIFRMGFMDGAEGLNIALIIYTNTGLKYRYLKRYQQQKCVPSASVKVPAQKPLAIEYQVV